MKFPALLLLLLCAVPAMADSKPIEVHVRDWFRVGFDYRVNVQMPAGYDNGGRWSLTCDRGISGGNYAGIYDLGRNDLRLSVVDLKGHPKIAKCHVFSHDWRQPR